jgi:hypothetical protein
VNIVKEASRLYAAGVPVGPGWNQLGPVTQSVWIERAERKLAGDPYFWSVMPSEWHQAERHLRSQVAKLRSLNMNNKQLAELFDQLAETMTAISGCFRSEGGDSAGAEGNGKATGKVRGKPAAKPTKPAEDDEKEITEDTVREKLKELADAKGAATMKKALESVGAGRLSDVEEEQYEELLGVIEKLMSAKAAKGKAKKQEVDYDELADRFAKLVKADTAAAKKILKDNGLKKLSEVDQDDQDALEAISTAVDAAMEGGDEDDDLVG